MIKFFSPGKQLEVHRNINNKWDAKRSADVTPVVNLRISLCTSDEASNQGQGSSEIQNRDISGPTKRTDVPQQF